MNCENDFASNLPVNQLPNYSNSSSSNLNYASSVASRSLSNRYYMLANLSPSSSYINNSDDNHLPHNRQNVAFKSRNNSRYNRLNRLFMHQSASAAESEFRLNVDNQSPQHNRTDLDSSSDNNDHISGNNSFDDNRNQPLRILRNFNNDVTEERNDSENTTNKVTTTNPKTNDGVEEKTYYSLNDQECFSGSGDELPYNWQASKSTVRERIASIFNNSTLADVIFIVGRSDGSNQNTVRRIPAHQFILAISSPVFDAMFYGPLSAKKSKCFSIFGGGDNKGKVTKVEALSIIPDEIVDQSLHSKEEKSILEVQVPDVEPIAFLALLKFIYTDEVHIGPDTVMTTLYVAKKYSVSALEKACVEYLRANLCSENAFMLLTQARLFNETQLANQCLDVIDKNTSDSLAADGFLEIDVDTLCTVLDRDTLGIREIKLFQAVMRWANYQVQKQHQQHIQLSVSSNVGTDNFCESTECNSKCSSKPTELIKQLIIPALKHIRFPLMSAEDFATHVAQSRLLDDKELVDMFLYYLSHNKPTIPYSEVPRCCLTGREQIINRYPVIEQRWGYSGTSDRIRFMVDRKIFVVGFGLYGSAQGPAEYQVYIEVLQQESGSVIASNFLTFKCDGTNSIFNVRFKEPVEILPNTSYIACATLKGPDSYYGSIGYQKVIHESATHGKVTFQFYYAAGNNNGTSVEDGQIPQIIFYM